VFLNCPAEIDIKDAIAKRCIPVADLENFTWGGKGVARGLGRVAGVDGMAIPICELL